MGQSLTWVHPLYPSMPACLKVQSVIPILFCVLPPKTAGRRGPPIAFTVVGQFEIVAASLSRHMAA